MSIWPIDGTLTGTIISAGQSGREINNNDVLYTSQSDRNGVTSQGAGKYHKQDTLQGIQSIYS